MKPENTYRQENLLHHWVRIIQELYPNTRTENPFQKELNSFSEILTLEEKLLFHDVLHCITLINAHSRQSSTKQLISTQTDFMNALQMVLPEGSKLTLKAIEIHKQLTTLFKDQPFSYLDACTRLRISKSTLKRIMKPLLIRGLIIKQNETKEKKTLFQAIKIDVTHEEPQLNPFETMQGDWKDFVGFIEF